MKKEKIINLIFRKLKDNKSKKISIKEEDVQKLVNELVNEN